MKLKTNLSIIVCSIQKSPAKRKNSGNRWNERNILILIYHKISLNKQGSLLEYCKRIVQIKWNKLQSFFLLAVSDLIIYQKFWWHAYICYFIALLLQERNCLLLKIMKIWHTNHIIPWVLSFNIILLFLNDFI